MLSSASWPLPTTRHINQDNASSGNNSNSNKTSNNNNNNKSAMQPTTRRARLEWLLAGGLALIALGLLIALAGECQWDDNEDCCPRREMISLDLTRVARRHSADLKVLAALAGYIELFELGFVPMNLVGVTMDAETLGARTQSRGHIRLATSSANLSLAFELNQTTAQFTAFDWRLHENLGQVSECQLELADGPIVFPSAERYSCLGLKVYLCRQLARDGRNASYSRPAGQLVLEVLEVQLFGERLATLEDEFSKGPAAGGCGA